MGGGSFVIAGAASEATECVVAGRKGAEESPETTEDKIEFIKVETAADVAVPEKKEREHRPTRKAALSQ